MEKMINGDDDDVDKMIGSSSEGKMVIKLKIPKLAESSAGEKTTEKDVIGILNPSEEGKKICLECNKEFSSGKALGGHMRVHVNKNPNFLKPPKTTTFKKPAYQGYNNKPYYMNSVNEEGEPTCSQCGKGFPSMKSLFGHMRCHPERVWRGILPPPNTPLSTTTTSTRRRTLDNKLNSSDSGSSYSSLSENGGGGGDQVVDLRRVLRGWSVTDRRGRRSLKAAEDDDVLLEAVEDLMSLANATAAGGSRVEVTENSLAIKAYGGGKGKAVIDDEIDDGDESDSNQQLLINYNFKNWNPNNINNWNPKRKRMKLMMELEPTGGFSVVHGRATSLPPLPEPQQQQPVVTECKYKCTTCNKCYTTHQALGGHRSSHNKLKLTSADCHLTEEYYVSGENLEKEVHQCKISDKVFATGQALGGHQRCHWVAQAPVSQITSAGEGGSQTGSDRKVFEFDLNEVPPAMMEEDEGGINGSNGNGYASSSYNSNIC